MDTPRDNKEQKLFLQDRKMLTLNGVENIIDFSEDYLSLKTNMGVLAVEGKDMKIESLSKDTGEVHITGHISGMYYKSFDDKRSFISKIFG